MQFKIRSGTQNLTPLWKFVNYTPISVRFSNVTSTARVGWTPRCNA